MKSYLPPFFLFLLASAVGIQAQGIADVLATDGNLSMLRSILAGNPALTQLLDDPTSGQRTFLAPSDAAFAKFSANITNGGPQVQMEAILSYHVMNGSFSASNLTSPGGVAAATFLQDSQYTNLGGNGGVGNMVYASQYGNSGESTAAGKLEVFGGVGNSTPIVRTDIRYGNGYVHIVDDLLPLPQTCTSSMGQLALSSLLQALNTAALAQTLDNTPGVTCFAPTQDAFTAAGNPEGKLSREQLSDAVNFHTLGKATYSPDLKTGASYPTLNGQNIKVIRDGGSLYVSGGGSGKAKVVRGNVIVKNGVMHVIDQILTPSNGTNGTTTSSSSPSSTGGSRGATTTASTTGKPNSGNANSGNANSGNANSGNRIVPSTALLFTIIGVIFSGLF